MRIGVIRGDLPGPIFLADLETVSQRDPAIEPPGQTYYVSRPTTAELETVLASTVGAGATTQGSNISATFPLTIGAGTQTLKIRASAAAAYTVVLVPLAAYNTLADLVAGVNTVLVGTGFVARAGVATGTFAIESTTYGVNSYLQVDSTIGGSTFNTPAGFLAGGVVRTMPAAASYITACNPIGALDVSTATMNGVGVGTNSTALAFIPALRGTQTALAQAIAPRIVETEVALRSFQVGNIAGFKSANFCPDSRRLPPLPSGPAIAVVQDDGVTAFAYPVPNVVNAVVAGGNLTINGTGLGTNERKETVVKTTGAVYKVLEQAAIEHAGGTVAAGQIVVPLTMLVGLAPLTSVVAVKVATLASNSVATS